MPAPVQRRSPLGNYARSTPDWFVQYAGVIGMYYRTSAGNDARVSLYNNDQTGQYCHVYNALVGNDAAGLYGGSVFAGPPGTIAGRAQSVVPTQPTPNVFIGYDDVACLYGGNEFPAGALGPLTFFLDNEAGSVDQWKVNGPIVVLPSGYSLGVRTIQPSGITSGPIMTATFYFVMLPDMS